MKANEKTRKDLAKLLYLPVSLTDINLFAIYFYGIFLIALSPTIKEAIVAIAVETLLMAITFLKPVQKYFSPKSYRPLVAVLEGSEMPDRDFLTSLVRLPFLKASHLTIFYFVKNATIGAVVVVFYWEHPGYTYLEQYLRYMLLELFVLTTFFLWVYVTAHSWASSLIQRLQGEGQLRSVMGDFDYPPQVSFRLVSLISLILLGSLALAILALKFAPLSTYEPAHKWQAAFIVGGVIAFIAYQVNQILHLILKQMEGNTVALEGFQREGVGQLPLSTISFIGRYQSLTNRFFSRLREKEQELSAWVLNEAEKERHDHIGAISSLIAHDLAAPVTTLKYCVDKIDTKGSLEPDEIQHMKVSTTHIFDLSRSLRNALRADEDESYSLHDALASARSLVDIEFHKQAAYKSIKYEIDLGPSPVPIRSLPKLYLIQVFTNLFKNSTNGLLTNHAEDRVIRLAAHVTDTHIQIRLGDTAQGFSKMSFQELTADNIFLTENKKVRKGLGLRMSLRMLEAYDGLLTFVDGPTPNESYFHVSIPHEAKSNRASRNKL